jgi:hypothetical protein
MIKFIGETQDGGRLIGIGLSRSNCDKLLEHHPIRINLRTDLNIPWRGEILIIAGESEATLTEELSPLIGPETVVTGDKPDQQELSEARRTKLVDGFRCEITVDPEKKMIVFQMAAPVDSFGLTAEGARRLAAELLTRAAQCEKL